MFPIELIIAWTGFLAWLYLAILHGGLRQPYWLRRDRLEAAATTSEPAGHAQRPGVVAVIPARDEADVIGPALAGLLAQRYTGRFDIILVDDQSADGTAAVAVNAAAAQGRSNRLHVITGRPRPPGWSGKVWAMSQGLDKINSDKALRNASYILFTDADIRHDPGLLTALAAKAEQDGLDLVSLMAYLRQDSFWEKLLIPAFVYFFRLLYPFPLVNDPGAPLAGAAGGCMLVNRRALERIGGLEAIKSAIIDDCALARAVKAQGPIWLGLTRAAQSLRPYGGLPGVWRMVARTAYTQLSYSPWRLAVSIVGLGLVFLVPPLALAYGLREDHMPTALAGGLAWVIMSLTYTPMVCEYGFNILKILSLPIAACLYMLMTLDSAWEHWRGRGAAWKGRVYLQPDADDAGTVN